MLVRRARTYSSYFLKAVSVYVHAFYCNLLSCSQKSRKNQLMPLFQSSKLFKVIDVNTTKNRSPVPVMISSMSVLICNHFYANQANVEEITTLTVTPI